jgi:RNA polymerase-binding transcription factor DksA
MDSADKKITEQQSARLLQLMEGRREDLRRQIAARRDALGAHGVNSEPAEDQADTAFHRTSAEIENELIDRYLREIAELDAARARAREGGLGICIECGTQIDYRRLEAFPAALRCMRCQTLHEKTYSGAPAALTQY